MESVFNYLREWNKTTNERVKLQHVYACAAIALLVIAGLFGLVNSSISDLLLQLTFAAAALFVINAIAWALLDSFILQRLKTKRK